jgi:dTDP-4-amino-4,6-dideoxy-D-galactose acyltransferase
MDYSEILSRCKDRLFFYSPYRFIQDCDRDTIFVRTVFSPWLDKIQRGAITVQQVLVGGEAHHVLIEPLAWDTRYFGYPVYKVHTVLYAHDQYGLLKEAMLQWTAQIANELHSFYFLDIPSEDIHLIQAICECGFRLTETRLHYVLSKFDACADERYPVRKPTENDLENLKMVAARMKNPYDRLHADIAFQEDVADAYLATYIENAMRGFADLILVPAEGNGPPDGFITSSFPERILGKRVAKFGNTAISNKTRKGWLRKLISETLYVLKDKGTDYILVNTQPSNGPSNKVLISFGFKFAFGTHIFSKGIKSQSSPNI